MGLFPEIQVIHQAQGALDLFWLAEPFEARRKNGGGILQRELHGGNVWLHDIFPHFYLTENDGCAKHIFAPHLLMLQYSPKCESNQTALSSFFMTCYGLPGYSRSQKNCLCKE